MKKLFEENSPEFLLVADKPIGLGGVSQKLAVEDIKEKFGFTYGENIIFSDDVPPIDQKSTKLALQKMNNRLKNPLNNKLVICFIDEGVGYGVFANEPIEAGTVIGVYSGQIEQVSEQNDYGMRIPDSNFRINAREFGGITRFIQHMPYYPPSSEEIMHADKNTFLQIAESKGTYFDEKQKKILNNPRFLAQTIKEMLPKLTTLLPDEKDILEGRVIQSIPNIATANVRPVSTIYNKRPVIYFMATRDIQAGEQLGVNYGYKYWIQKGVLPHYFNNKGEIVPRNLYTSLDKILDSYPSEDKRTKRTINDVLHHAAFNGDVSTVRLLLLEYNAFVDDQNDDTNNTQRTPLHCAIIGYGIAIAERENNTARFQEVISCLIERKANLNITDKFNSSSLHYAVKNNLLNIVTMLFSQGIDINLKDRWGFKPFDYSLFRDNLALAEKVMGSQGVRQDLALLVSRYKFNKTLPDVTYHWVEGEAEEASAGYYIDCIKTDNVSFIYFGKKSDNSSISIVNIDLKNPNYFNKVQAIKEVNNSFNEIQCCYLCLPPGFSESQLPHDFLSEIKEINYKSINIEGSIVLARYIFSLAHQKIMPNIAYINETDLKHFYGELTDYSPALIKKEKGKPASANSFAKQQTFISNIGINEALPLLNNITENICNKKWNSGKNGSASLKAANKESAETIKNYLIKNEISNVTIVGGNRVIIENLNISNLNKIKPIILESNAAANTNMI